MLCGGVDTGGSEFEANKPGAGDAVALGFGAGELPLAGGFFSKAGKIFAWAGRVKRSVDHIPRRIHLNFHNHVETAVNRVEGLLRGLRQDFVEDFATPGNFGRGLCARGGRGFRA